MARLALSVLGPIQVVLEGVTITSFQYDKVQALLVYLAVEADRPHRREALAELLWPENDGPTARHSLSQALFCLRAAIDDRPAAPFLLRDRTTVQFNAKSDHWLDVAAFSNLLAASERHLHRQGQVCEECAQWLGQAVDTCRGNFLEQLAVPDSVAFEEWATIKRALFQRQALHSLDRLIGYYEHRGALVEACSYAQRQVALDPCQEAAHRRLIGILAASGQRGAALAQYERCREILADELGVEPERKTTLLYQRILNGANLARAPLPSLYSPSAPRRELPAQPTPFVGRDAELARVADLLSNPDSRLVTLVGPGGIGKTRLGIQAAARLANAFADGVCFVPLVGVPSSKMLVPAIASALAFSFYAKEEPLKQLLGYLQNREVLLVLDNFEHLVEGASLLSKILSRAPKVRILVTSRERLNLREEWVVDVEGLGVPGEDESSGIENYSAVQLFVQSARRAQSGFSLYPRHHQAVARICRLVGGMPLGIELAAAWVPVLSCEDIAREIKHSVDFLSVQVRDLPERHRSIRAVFDRSWQMLDPSEQRVFCALSVFRDGFRREAAEHIAGRSLPILSALVSKSLLRRRASGRYEIHELLRQYAEDRLDSRPEDAGAIRRQHGEYYADFLARTAESLKGPNQETALADVGEENENVRAAWHWAAQHRCSAMIANAVHGLWLFSEIAGRYLDAGAAFEEAAMALEDNSRATDADDSTRALARGRLFAHWGSFFVRLGNYERGSALIDRGLAVLESLGSPSDLGLALNFRAMCAHARRDYRQEEQDLQESIRHFEAANDRWGLAYSMNDLGMAVFLLGDAVEAERLSQQSLLIFTDLGDKRGMAFALRNRGIITFGLGNHGEARRYLTECLKIRQSIGNRWGIADSLNQLGVVARSTGDHEESLNCFLGALRVAVDIHAMAVAIEILSEFADVLTTLGEPERAARIRDAIAQHPEGGPAIQNLASQLLDEIQPSSIGDFST